MRQVKIYIVSLVLCFLCGIGFVACGGGDSDDSTLAARIVEILFDDATVPLGESSVLRSRFTYSASDVFQDDGLVYLLFRIPPQLGYRPGSAEVQRPISDDSVDPQIELCPNGDIFLSFRLDAEDLAAATNPEGDADAELALTIDTRMETGIAVIEAAAREANTPFICDRTFVPDVAIGLRITQAVDEMGNSTTS